jgi:hypothetical protein
VLKERKMETEEHKRLETIIRATEKAVQMVMDLQETIRQLRDEVTQLTDRVGLLEIDVRSAEDTDAYMQAHKNDIGPDVPLNNDSIKKLTEDYYSRRGN